MHLAESSIELDSSARFLDSHAHANSRASNQVGASAHRVGPGKVSPVARVLDRHGGSGGTVAYATSGKKVRTLAGAGVLFSLE